MGGSSSGKGNARKKVAGSKKKVSSRKASTRSVARNPRTGAAVRKGSSRKGNLFIVGEEERLDRLVEGFGNNRVAELLGVSRSQPSRWRSGKEGLGPGSARRLVDIDYVLARLLQLYPRRQAEIWLTSHNAHLGARPIDVLHLRGVSPVIEAIDAEAEGAFA